MSESILVSNPFQIHSYSDATATSGWTSSVTNSLYFSFENHQIATCRRDQSRIPSDLRCRLAESATVSCSPTVRQCYFPKSLVFLKVRGAASAPDPSSLLRPRRRGLLRWREEALARTAQRPSAYQPPVSHSALVLLAAPWWGARADVARRHRDRPVGVDEGEQCCGS